MTTGLPIASRFLGVLRWAFCVALTGFWSTLGILTWPISPSGHLYLAYARIWSRMALWGCGVRVVVKEDPGSIDWTKPYVVMSSHESLLDIFALFAVVPCDIRMLAKAELKGIPVLGWSMWMAGFVFIDRKSAASARWSIDRGARAVKAGRTIVVFPEGTRSESETLLPFKKGGFVLAIRAGVPILPIAICGSRQALPKHALLPRPGVIELRFGQPIPTHGYTIERKAELSDLTREAIAGLKRGEARQPAPMDEAPVKP